MTFPNSLVFSSLVIGEADEKQVLDEGFGAVCKTDQLLSGGLARVMSDPLAPQAGGVAQAGCFAERRRFGFFTFLVLRRARFDFALRVLPIGGLLQIERASGAL